jgi:hypothetical protein
MPLTEKGTKIMGAMKKNYGDKKGESVFYASRNKGRIEGVDKATSKSHRWDGSSRGGRRRAKNGN